MKRVQQYRTIDINRPPTHLFGKIYGMGAWFGSIQFDPEIEIDSTKMFIGYELKINTMLAFWKLFYFIYLSVYNMHFMLVLHTE